MEVANFKLDVVLYNTVIDSLCKDRLVTVALNLSFEMTSKGIHPELVTYNSLIHGLCNSGLWKEATKLLHEMVKRKIMPDVCTFNILVDTLRQKGNAYKGKRSLRCDDSKGIEPDVVTYSSLIDTLGKEWMLTKAKEAFDVMIQSGIDPNVIIYISIIDDYCLQNKMEALKVLNLMLARGCSPSAFTYNILIHGYCKSKQIDEATCLYQEMSKNGIILDVVAHTAFIGGLCRVGRSQAAVENSFIVFLPKGFQPAVRTYTIIIKGYCKEGLLNEACALLKQMDWNGCSPDYFTYNAIIQGHLLHKETSKAMKYL
ncbi:hypothetical protein CJ030_MR2G001434 [Morella rubra]|uniref:Pentatricopeptide repeat-containing protein n=1 Tax=Morella rubra TaxID=262757 RepID=A0A6A1WDF5_9ROSI|nr:hypothetical protein CJ030_MR2G001434 [Morella rubra]